MKIVIERQGGVAGIRRRRERDDADLTEAQRAALERIVTAAPASVTGGAPDRFVYKIEVIHGDGSPQVMRVPESAMPEELKLITG